MGIYDVPAGMLIDEVAKDLKARVKKPVFTEYAKTGAHRERTPNNPDWFYTRMASVLYRVYKEGNTGTGTLRTYYGGRKNRGVKPEHKVKASGKIIRVCLQNLEKEGLVKKEKKGRKVTPRGEKYLYEKARAAQKTFDEINAKREQQEKEEAQKRIADRQKQHSPAAQEIKKETKPVQGAAKRDDAQVQTKKGHEGAKKEPAEQHGQIDKPEQTPPHTGEKQAGQK